MKAAGPIGVVIDKIRGRDRGSGGFSPLAKIDIVVRRSTAISPSLSWGKVASWIFNGSKIGFSAHPSDNPGISASNLPYPSMG